jgi:hypothetical protein
MALPSPEFQEQQRRAVEGQEVRAGLEDGQTIFELIRTAFYVL